MTGLSLSPPTPMPAQLVWYARCATLTSIGLLANRGALHRAVLRKPINLISVRETSAPEVRQGYLDHSLPNLIREGDAATALWSYSLNGRSRLLAVGHTWHMVLVVARHDSGIETVGQLKGRKLALPRELGDFSPASIRTQRGWESILEAEGLKVADVYLQTIEADYPSVPFGDIARREVAAVLNGQADSALLFGAKGIELARNSGLRVIRSFAAEEIRENPHLGGLAELRSLTVDHPFLEACVDVVGRLVSVLTGASDWAEKFPEEALHHVALEGNVDPRDAAEAYGSLLFAGATLGLEGWRMRDVETMLAWLKAHGAVDKSTEIRPWLREDVLGVSNTRR